MINLLQIISGKYKGKKLAIPDGSRPTQQRTRGAVFNILNSIFAMSPAPSSVTVWDAFAGSGAMGIEFISRFGATAAIFTDTNPDAIKAIIENTKNIKDCKIIINQKDALNFTVPATESLVIFIDPPYSESKLGQKLIDKLGKTAAAGTIIIWEFERNFKFLVNDSQFLVMKNKIYGRARFLIMTRT